MAIAIRSSLMRMRRLPSAPVSLLHIPTLDRRQEEKVPQLHQFRNSQMFHSSTKQQSLLVSGSIILACGAYGTKIIYNAYESHQAAKEKEERENPQPKEEAVADDTSTAEETISDENTKEENKEEEKKVESKPFDLDEWWENFEFKMPKMPSASSVEGMRYYKGGFEEKMTRREAAQILGIRESADAKRVKAAHRKILIANHPDKGGSPYMAAKINQAKEMLIKGKE